MKFEILCNSFHRQSTGECNRVSRLTLQALRALLKLMIIELTTGILIETIKSKIKWLCNLKSSSGRFLPFPADLEAPALCTSCVPYIYHGD